MNPTIGRIILKTGKHSPTILFVGGVVGVVATTVLASRGTLQFQKDVLELKADLDTAKEVLARDSEAYTREDYNKDVVTLNAKLVVAASKRYAPAVFVGFISIAMLTKSHRILTSRNAAVTAAYAALEKGFDEYRRRVVQEYGEEIDRRLRFSRDLELKPKLDSAGKEIKSSRNPYDYSVYARFFDQTCKDYNSESEYNFMFLRAKQNYANDLLRSRGHVFLNEVYSMLGFEHSKAGAVVGWIISSEGDNFIDFGIFDHDRERARAFVNGHESAILLDFNVDGVIYDKI
jgi:hypothetical protein